MSLADHFGVPKTERASGSIHIVGSGIIHHFDTSMCLFAGFQSAAIPPHFTALQRENAGEATALTRLSHVCVVTSGAQADS